MRKIKYINIVNVLLIVFIVFYLLTFESTKPVVIELKDNAGIIDTLDKDFYRSSSTYKWVVDSDEDVIRYLIKAHGEIRPGCGAEGCFGRCDKCE